MRALVRTASAVVLVLSLLPQGAARAADPDRVRLGFRALSSGLAQPTAVVTSRDGTGRIFVAEQAGRIRVRVPGSGLRSTPYLDIRGRVSCCGERGLLGLAFHPRFKDNGYFFVFYTDNGGDLRVSRFRASPYTDNTIDPATERSILRIEHSSHSNHNGGQLQFWDGLLYISTGDGGGAGDPNGNAQNRWSLLGKILRIDVNRSCGSRRYCSPGSNPFYGSKPGAAEVWHYGLRNPWRFSMDRRTGRLYIGDVGQDAWEEIDTSPEGVAPKNWGWDCREGTANTSGTYGGSYCSGRSFSSPIRTYSNNVNGRCAVVGGYVYRGAREPELYGIYVYADYCSGEMWGLMKRSDGTWDSGSIADISQNPTSFGQNASGEMYMVTAQGNLYEVTARAT